MKLTDKIGWAVVAFCVAVTIAFLLAGRTAHGAPLSLHDRIVRAAPSVASRKDTPVDFDAFATAVTSQTKIREWAALLMTVAAHESALSARIQRGECRPLECDRGRAWGLWQMHKNTLNAEAWGSTELSVQASEAQKGLRRAFYQCQKGPLRKDWVRRTLAAYAGHSCDGAFPGLDARVATYERLLRQF